MATELDNSPIARHAGAGFGHEDRLRRAKYLGALADRLFRNKSARLGLDANEAIKSPLLSIITRQGGRVVTPAGRYRGQAPVHNLKTLGRP